MPAPFSRLAALVDELKRRGVLRVAAVYLIGAWLLMQVADITFTRLGMPDWTVTFVIVLGVLLFPVVVGVAWAFDLTRRGFERTAPRADPHVGAAPGHAAGGSATGAAATSAAGGAATGNALGGSATAGAATAPPARKRPRATVAAAALLTIPLVGFGLWYMRSDARGFSLDPQLVAVTPFRVAGASPDVHYLREGLMDLVAARFGGAGGELKVVSPRTVSRLLRDELGSLEADPAQDEALALARRLGAGRLLAGEVVGGSDRLVVTASLYDVLTGELVGAPATIRTHPDSLHHLVDEIASRLVAADAGLTGDRLAHLTTTSLPALRAFLEAEQAFRRGRHEDAVRGYDHAVSLDTTFALAALGLLRARGWSWSSPAENDWDVAYRIVRRGADRLSEGDRMFFEASAGPEEVASYSHLVDVRLRAAERMPEMPELRYLAGDALLHFGEGIGIEDGVERGRRMLDETVTMDSTYAEPLIHLHDLALADRDTAATLRYGSLLLAIDSLGPIAALVHHARSRGYAGQRFLTDELDPDTLPTFLVRLLAAIGANEPHDDRFVRELKERFDAATLPQEVGAMVSVIEQIGMRRGQPSFVEAAYDRNIEFAGWLDIQRLAMALYWLRDLDAVRSAAAEVRRNHEAGREARTARAATGDAPRPLDPDATMRRCLLGHAAITEGDFEVPARIADWLAQVPATGRDAWAVDNDRTCILFLRAAAAVYRSDDDALRRLGTFDDSLHAGKPADPYLNQVYQLAAARLWEEVGQPQRALAAVRRHIYLPGAAMWIVEMWGEEARLADQLGRRDQAIEAYRRYLAHREHAEPPFRARAEQARARLAALAGEQ